MKIIFEIIKENDTCFLSFSAPTWARASVTSHLDYFDTLLIRLPASTLARFILFPNEWLELSRHNSDHITLSHNPPMTSQFTQLKCQGPFENPQALWSRPPVCFWPGLLELSPPSLCSVATLPSFTFMNIPGIFLPQGPCICCSGSPECSFWDICMARPSSPSGVKCHLLGEDLPDRLPAHPQHSLCLFSFYFSPEHI